MLNIVDGFKIFGFEIKFYGVTMALSYLIAFIVCIILCKKKQYSEKLPYRLLLLVFPLAVIGGRLGYVIFSGRSWTIAEIINIRSGGLMLYGGIVFALLGVVVYALIRRQNVLRYFDLVAPCLIIAIALGRWGNFFNQEAFGVPVTNPKLQWFPFSVFIENSTDISKWHLATFFYESVWCVLSFIIIYIVYRKTERTGLSTALFLFLYGIERFFVEGLRTDSLMLLDTGIRVSQLVSALMVGVAIGYFIFLFVVKLQEKKHYKLHLQFNIGRDKDIEEQNMELGFKENQVNPENVVDEKFVKENVKEEIALQSEDGNNIALNDAQDTINEENQENIANKEMTPISKTSKAERRKLAKLEKLKFKQNKSQDNKIDTNIQNEMLNNIENIEQNQNRVVEQEEYQQQNQKDEAILVVEECPKVEKRLQRIKERLNKQRSDFVSEQTTKSKQTELGKETEYNQEQIAPKENCDEEINQQQNANIKLQNIEQEKQQSQEQNRQEKEKIEAVEENSKVDKRLERIKEQLNRQRNKK